PSGDPGVVLRLGLALGNGNLPFEDPTTMEERESSRFFMGQWAIDHGALQQEDLPASAGMSFRRYDGSAFGSAGGLAPSHYRVETEVSAFAPSGHGPADIPGSPVGALGIIPYFRDTTHYTLLVATPTDAELWMVDGLRPGDEWDAATYRRWLYELPSPLHVGDNVRWGADIDTKAQTIQISFQGRLMEILTDPFLQNIAHSVALVSNGNYVRYSSLVLRPE
ncbi:MAG: hypothetical protein KGR26_04390, partial [Cyanobacteria bacterium REEB65]|nr:hypothetical protein [Cyanobacteria bacterium REEB65]